MPSKSDRLPNGFPSSVYEMAELGELFQQHWRRLVAIIQKRIDPAFAVQIDPEDIVNSAFITAQRRWSKYKENRLVSEFVWLYRIVTDTWIEERRKATAGVRNVYRRAQWDEPKSIDLCLQLVAGGKGPATEAVHREQSALMRQAVDSLDEQDAEIIRLRAHDDLSFAEIAEHLGIRTDAAAKRYVRAVHKLKGIWRCLTGESRP